MPTYKLTYFNGKGRAELTRLLFTAADVEFTDHRIDYYTDWPEIKPQDGLHLLGEGAGGIC
uniref:GST N-terminal domain-containing protein n=1 Tax=Octopus bimaculoides TaxID=37653 RepID=A0A0L8GDQ8_OCTBM